MLRQFYRFVSLSITLMDCVDIVELTDGTGFGMKTTLVL